MVSPIIITLQKNCLGCRLGSHQTHRFHGTHVPRDSAQPGRRQIPSNISPWQMHGHKVSSSRDLPAGGPQPGFPNKGTGLVLHGNRCWNQQHRQHSSCGSQHTGSGLRSFCEGGITSSTVLWTSRRGTAGA